VAAMDDPQITKIRELAQQLAAAVQVARKAGWTVEISENAGKMKFNIHRRLEHTVPIEV